MITKDTTSFAQKKAKCSLIVWGFTYLFLFLFLFFFFAPYIGYVANSINISFKEKLIGFITLLPIFAIPLSFILMCLSYSRAYYKVACFCWMIPIFFFAVVFLMHIILAQA